MANRSINVKDIKGFEQSDIVVSDQKLLEESSEAFGTPIITTLGDGTEAVSGTWVKKNVKRSRFDKYFKNHPSYIPIKENENSITVAFVVPTHLVDLERVTKNGPLRDREATEINKNALAYLRGLLFCYRVPVMNFFYTNINGWKTVIRLGYYITLLAVIE